MYNTAAAATTARATQATPTPTTCGSYPPGAAGANCSSSKAQDGATSSATGEPRVFLLLCLRGIAAFVWAASRSTLQRMLLAYLQSVLVSPTWRPLLAAVPRRLLVVSRGVALRARDTVTVAHRAANPNGKKVSWSYLRGTYDSKFSFFFWFKSHDEGAGRPLPNHASNRTVAHLFVGVSLALSELCQDGRFGGGRIPLSAILDLSTPPIHLYMAPWPMFFFWHSETASECARPSWTARRERRPQATRTARTSSHPLIIIIFVINGTQLLTCSQPTGQRERCHFRPF